MDLLGRSRRPNYEVGGRVQNVLESVVVHHERVGTGGADVVGTTYHRGTLVPYNWLQDLKILIYGGVVGLPDNLAVGGIKYFT